MATPVAPLKILSIVGAGRSGTTVLASILGEIDGFASAGELRWLWERGVVEQRPCGCGETPVHCPVWSPVVSRALATSDMSRQLDIARQIIVSQQELTRRRNLLRVLFSADGGHSQWSDLQRVRAFTGAAARAFAEECSARVVVDTSKRPLDAAVFASLEDVEHYVLHVVRDPRAVVHSWRRAKAFDVAGAKLTMGTRRLPATVRRWTANCLSAEVLRSQLPGSRWLHIRYEDFARHPQAAVAEILALLGESGKPPFD
nr:sulfotransferase [Propionibacteriales bacterium]